MLEIAITLNIMHSTHVGIWLNGSLTNSLVLICKHTTLSLQDSAYERGWNMVWINGAGKNSLLLAESSMKFPRMPISRVFRPVGIHPSKIVLGESHLEQGTSQNFRVGLGLDRNQWTLWYCGTSRLLWDWRAEDAGTRIRLTDMFSWLCYLFPLNRAVFGREMPNIAKNNWFDLIALTILPWQVEKSPTWEVAAALA